MVVGRRRVCAYWPKEPQVPPLRFAPVEKHSQERTAGPQISPLRFAPVEMTKGRAALPLSVVAEQSLLFITLGGPKEIQGSVVEGPAVLSAITHTLRRA